MHYLAFLALVTLMSVCTGLGWADMIGRQRGQHFGRLGTGVTCAVMTVVWALVFSLTIVNGSFIVVLTKLLPGLAVSGAIGALVPMTKHAKPIQPKQ